MIGSYGCQTKNVKLQQDILIKIKCKINNFSKIFIEGLLEKSCYFTDLVLFQLQYFTVFVCAYNTNL